MTPLTVLHYALAYIEKQILELDSEMDMSNSIGKQMTLAHLKDERRQLNLLIQSEKSRKVN